MGFQMESVGQALCCYRSPEVAGDIPADTLMFNTVNIETLQCMH